MSSDFTKAGQLVVEIKMFNPEKLLNILWNKGIEVRDVKKLDIITIRMAIDYKDYDEINDYVVKFKGMIDILSGSGLAIFLIKIKKKLSYVVGVVLFLFIIFFLSNFVWCVKISDGNIVSPYDIRKCIYGHGVKPGVLKRDINLKNVEKIIEDNNENIVWVRARIEGSALKIDFKEKITPPAGINQDTNLEDQGDIVASMDGEIIKIYTSSGTAVVNRGDFVKKGDLLIEGIQGKEEYKYNVRPEGTILAKTLIEKTADVKIGGTELERTGEIRKDIYIQLFGKKIYIKKCNKDFNDYDKIENTKSFIKEDIYYIKKEVPMKEDSDNLINKKLEEIDKEVQISLKRSEKILDKNVNKENIDDQNVRLKVTYAIEKSIGIRE